VTDYDEEDEDEELKGLKAKEKENVGVFQYVVERKDSFVIVKVPITPHTATNVQVCIIRFLF
jgi:hypothetical protein